MTIKYFQRLIEAMHVEATSTTLELKDTDSEMSVSVSGVPQSGLLINVMHGRAHPTLMKEGDYRKSCDKILLIQNDNSIDAYLIELKKTLRPNKARVPRDACHQIINTIPVLDYLISMIEIHFHDKININKYLVAIGIKVADNLAKRSTTPKSYYNCCYEGNKIRVIHSAQTSHSVQTIPFTELK